MKPILGPYECIIIDESHSMPKANDMKPVLVLSKFPRWVVKTKGARRACKVCDTHSQAVAVGRRVARARGGTLIVYKADRTVDSVHDFTKVRT